jgi:uncharacterized protein YecE (DUF72 family)
MGRILAGTAGWTDPSLIKSRRFYPRGFSSPEGRLRYYASQFPMVEVDSSYYALPALPTVEHWVERTPANFVFNVKAFAALTEHALDVQRLPHDLQAALPEGLRARGRLFPRDLPGDVQFEVWQRFREALEPLQQAGKLGCVLLQFPPWFDATRGHARTIEVCRARLPGVPLAVEFRHASWGEPARFHRVVAMLRGLKMAYVVVDEPQGKVNSMPPTLAVADPSLAVVRFHGHRGETWDASVGVQEKFDYLYDPAELSPWVPKVRTLAAEAEQVHVVFNNCVSNHAVLGAKDLMALLAESEARA